MGLFRGLLVLAAGLAIAAPALAGPNYGPAVGDKIPAGFAAADSRGAAKRFTDITGSRGVVLAFVRSAKWCPYFHVQLLDLQTIDSALKQRGYTLASLSYDDPAVLDAFIQKEKISYLMLSDHGSKVIDAWKLRDEQYKSDSFAYGVPHPAIFVVSRSGVIEARLEEEGYKVRPPAASVLAAIDHLKR
jgi:peroxiredoxin